MRQVSQEEFERYVEEMIAGRISKAQVVKELQTDARTLNNKIQELVATNPELYQRYIVKKPYKPRERKDLDVMQLALEILKQEKTIEQIAEEYQTGSRTIRRRINILKNSENFLEREIFELCKEVAKSNKAGKTKLSVELEIRIQRILEELEAVYAISEEIKSQQVNIEERREALLEIERKYNELCKTMSKTEAAQTLGYTTNRIYKLLNELYCIQIETNTKNFRQGLKVTTTEPIIQAGESRVVKEQEREQ